MDYQTDNKMPKGAQWLADAAVYYREKIKQTWTAMNAPAIEGPEDCHTIEQLRSYAQSIRHTKPGIASDLLAAIDRAEVLNN